MSSEFERERQALLAATKVSMKRLFEKYGITQVPDSIYDDAANKMVEDESDTDSDRMLTGDEEDSSTSAEGSASENEFQTVEGKRKKLRKSPQAKDDKKKKKTGEEGKTNNYFDILSKRKNLEIPPKQTQPPPNPRNPKPPPIICLNLNIKNFEKELSKLEQRPKFFIKPTKGTKCIIKPCTDEDHKVLFEVIRRNGLQGYSFTPKGERKTTLVLKGVQHTFPAEEVKLALQEELKGIPIKSVSHLETRRTKDCNAFVVVFDGVFELKKIMEVKKILHQIVYWERYRTKGVSQCKRCQGYGHIASNCTIDYKCVKCDKSHEPGKCGRLSKDEGKPFCVNCKKEGHPANYRGCPSYKKVIKERVMRNEQRLQREEFLKASTRNYIQPGKSFAQITSGRPQKPEVPQKVASTAPNPTLPPKSTPAASGKQAAIDDFCTNEARALFGCDLFTLMSKINNFLPQYRKLTSIAERQSAYLQFAFGLCLGN